MVGYLRLDGLRKSFGGQTALDGLDLELAEGELVSLLGPSGCGKTTALRVVAGFETADAGKVVVAGRDITGVPANKRDMGMVFQAYSLFPNLTVTQNVAFGLRLRKAPDRAGRVAELLELVGRAHLGKRYPHQLSGGQQQRVAIARSLVNDPYFILADEATGNLDSVTSEEILAMFERLNDQGRTIIMVTHEDDVAAHAKRIIRLRDGLLQSDLQNERRIRARTQAQVRGAELPAAGESAASEQQVAEVA
jgi:putative spermidine/putrescine transport system ATP-binding protein